MIKLLFLAIVPLAYTLTEAIKENTHLANGEHGDASGDHSDLNSPKVCTKYAGCIVGTLMPGYRIENFEAFLGIPYALPPVGELRFSNPKSYPRSLDAIDATTPKPDCIQKNSLTPVSLITGSEDCLYLNVYRPIRRRQTNKLPVMVYIHGGGWFTGSVHPNITGPHYLMDSQEVIVVTFSYRLGVFGFLATGDSVVPGNFGMKDQNLALKWVQKNIADFGGDPKQVTLFGQSAGAISAHMHMLSKQSEGLFQGIIALSGTANAPYALQNNSLELAHKIAELSGVKNAREMSTVKLLKALRAIDANVLLESTDAMKYWDVDPLTVFRPVVEDLDSSEAFLTREPNQISQSGDFKPVPFMAGIVPGEGAVRAIAILESSTLRSAFNRDFDYLLEQFLSFPENFNRSHTDHSMRSLIDEYFGGQHELQNQAFVDIVTDRGFHHPFYNTLKTFTNIMDPQRYPMYAYYFNYSGPFSFATLYTGGVPKGHYGVVHCDELIYLLRAEAIFPDFPKQSLEAKVSSALVSYFVNFAKNLHSQSIVQCNKSSFFDNSTHSMCDFTLFENGPNGSFNLKTDNKFDIRRMQFWDKLMAA